MISGCIIDAGMPDLFCAELAKADMAEARPLVPALPGMAVPIPPPMPPIITDDWPILPSIMPSDESFIMAVTKADDTVMPWPLAYWDIAAIAIP